MFRKKEEIALSFPSNINKVLHYDPIKNRLWHYKAESFTEDQRLQDAFQLYNGGHYWYWRPKYRDILGGPGTWVRDNSNPKIEYGDKARNIYFNHNYPIDWNK